MKSTPATAKGTPVTTKGTPVTSKPTASKPPKPVEPIVPVPSTLCPAGCGKSFAGKNPYLGVQRHLKIYAKQWKKYEEVCQAGGDRPKLTVDLNEVEKHAKEHEKSILSS